MAPSKKALDALGAWLRKAETVYSETPAVARLVLKDKRQLLKLMGLRAQ